ncbi:MAG: RNA polymerase factor sigma-54 [Burkholderiales bacterium]|jgi:RNA polymerase sigma-54 factor|nr:RNA polymerase factor sigma-54 [Burkholderiales bacterium]
MKQTLNVRLSQQLTLSPQLRQAIYLLQLSTLELNEEIDKMLEDNPLLEKDESDTEDDLPDLPAESVKSSSDTDTALPESEPDYSSDAGSDAEANFDANDEDSFEDIPTAFDAPDALEQEDFVMTSDMGGVGEDDDDLAPQIASGVSLREHLLAQLSMSVIEDTHRNIIEVMIDELNEDGYLSMTSAEFCEQYQEMLGVTPALFEQSLALLQTFEPTGVGARNLSECLVLQLQALPESEIQQAALAMARHHLPEVAKRAFSTIRRFVRVSEEVIEQAVRLIRTLNPRPGLLFSSDRADHVIPDTIVVKENGHWVAKLNDAAIPKIRINQLYAKFLPARREESGNKPAYLQEAHWLLRNIQQRFETILKVSNTIVDRQQRFFDHGPIAMQPMVLKDVAELLSLHESTISRVTSRKYMLTPQGVFELKYFFSSGITTSTGGVAASTAIRTLIKQIVTEESPKAPLSDQQISELLDKEGIMIARRTVAKYRESLSIPPAHLRKARF